MTKISENDVEWIKISKTLCYQEPSQNSKNLAPEMTLLISTGFSVAVTFTCKFRAEVLASTDQIEIEIGNEVNGKLEQEGNWRDSLKIEYWNSGFTSKVPYSISPGLCSKSL